MNRKETREFYEKSTMGMSREEKLKWVNNHIDSIEMCYDTIMDCIRDEYREYRSIKFDLEKEIKNA